MNPATLGKIAPGHHGGVPYEAKAMFSATGGYKAGYRFDKKAEWTWAEARFESLDGALDAACGFAREAISDGRHQVPGNAP